MQNTQQHETRRAQLWQQDRLTPEYDRLGKEIADIENPARVAMRRELEARSIRRDLSECRRRFIGWRKVLKTNAAYARKQGAETRQRLLGCIQTRKALMAELAQVQS